MPVLESLQRQIATAQELQSVVKTMKVLAAASMSQYERAVESLAEYTRTIEMGLQIVLGERNHGATSSGKPLHVYASTPTERLKNNCLGAIVFGSDQGMCGQFNEQIAEYMVTQIQHLSISSAELRVLVVGARVITALEAAGVTIEKNLMMPTSLAGITSMFQELLLHIEMWQSQLQINQIILFYNKSHSNTSCEAHTLQLLPIDKTWLQNLEQQKWLSRTLPTFTMDWSQLFSALIKQYLFLYTVSLLSL